MVNTGLQQILGMNPDSMSSVMDLIPDSVFVIDKNGLLTDSNLNFRKLFNIAESVHEMPLGEILPADLKK